MTVAKGVSEYSDPRNFRLQLAYSSSTTARQVTLGFDIPALYSSSPLLDGDHPRGEKVKQAAELLNCHIVSDEKTRFQLPDGQKPSLGPMLDSEPRISSYIQGRDHLVSNDLAFMWEYNQRTDDLQHVLKHPGRLPTTYGEPRGLS